LKWFLIHLFFKQINSIERAQQALSKQYSTLLFLVYLLLLLSLAQVLFQSDLYGRTLEPFVDYFLFAKKELKS
jgi:hypothetical protein